MVESFSRSRTPGRVDRCCIWLLRSSVDGKRTVTCKVLKTGASVLCGDVEQPQLEITLHHARVCLCLHASSGTSTSERGDAMLEIHTTLQYLLYSSKSLHLFTDCLSFPTSFAPPLVDVHETSDLFQYYQQHKRQDGTKTGDTGVRQTSADSWVRLSAPIATTYCSLELTSAPASSLAIQAGPRPSHSNRS